MEEPGKDPTITEWPLLARSVEPSGNLRRTPSTWKFKSPKFGRITLPYYVSPECQLAIASFVMFLGPGMYTILATVASAAIIGRLSDDGTIDAINNGSYICAAIIGFFAGTIINAAGTRTTTFLASLCYCTFTSSYLGFVYTYNTGYLIFGYCLTGCSIGLFWSTQFAIVLSCAPEQHKGRYIALLMASYSLARFVAVSISLSDYIGNTAPSTHNVGTLVAFLVLSFVCFGFSWIMVDIKSVERRDGSHVISMQRPTWKTEILGLWEVLGRDWHILLLFPVFIGVGHLWGYRPYMLGKGFTGGANRLNNMLYLITRAFGSLITGYALDISKVKRAARARLAWAYIFCLTFVVLGGGYAWELKLVDYIAGDTLDLGWSTSGYIAPMFLFMLYGFHGASLELYLYWLLGAMSNSSRKLAYFAGFQIGVVEAGAAIASLVEYKGMDAWHMNMLVSSWALVGGGLLIALPVVFRRIKDTTPIAEDLEFTDHEAFEDAPDHKDRSIRQDQRLFDPDISNLWVSH